jgi:hypothetical protein
MSIVRRIFSFLTSVIEREPAGRRQRIRYQPSAEQMEPRALQSELKVGVATLLPLRTSGGALVININQAPAKDELNFANDIKDQINVEN